MGVTKYKCHKCYECDEPIKKGVSKVKVKLFDNPYEKNPKVVYFHDDNDDEHGSCYEKAFDTSYGDFRLFECSVCGRVINMQCLSNGWHSYTREDKDGNDICLQCFEDHQFKYGAPREEFENSRVSGTFAVDKDFRDHGFEAVDGYQSFFIAGAHDAKRYCTKALELIDQGYLVMNEYERMGIGGSEGYVRMWAKKKEQGGNKCQKNCKNKKTLDSSQSDSASP